MPLPKGVSLCRLIRSPLALRAPAEIAEPRLSSRLSSAVSEYWTLGSAPEERGTASEDS